MICMFGHRFADGLPGMIDQVVEIIKQVQNTRTCCCTASLANWLKHGLTIAFAEYSNHEWIHRLTHWFTGPPTHQPARLIDWLIPRTDPNARAFNRTQLASITLSIGMHIEVCGRNDCTITHFLVLETARARQCSNATCAATPGLCLGVKDFAFPSSTQNASLVNASYGRTACPSTGERPCAWL